MPRGTGILPVSLQKLSCAPNAQPGAVGSRNLSLGMMQVALLFLTSGL